VIPFILSHHLVPRRINRSAAVLLLPILLFAAASVRAAEPELVNIKAVDPTIVVELRYAGTRNVAGRPLYPSHMPALARPSVAAKLAEAQTFLRSRGFGLKIWDAYRPKAAHDQLWEVAQNSDYVADPKDGHGSLHTWGVAIDATLVDSKGRNVAMPTDFDDFSPAAMLYYRGPDQKVRYNVRMLQAAMARAGFYGMRTEWWHFVVKDWKNYKAIPEVKLIPPAPRTIQASSPQSSGGAPRPAPPSR
jgi:D-alanyl-D-alanine dipeptidase